VSENRPLRREEVRTESQESESPTAIQRDEALEAYAQSFSSSLRYIKSSSASQFGLQAGTLPRFHQGGCPPCSVTQDCRLRFLQVEARCAHDAPLDIPEEKP
jgi:hypothetical protein